MRRSYLQAHQRPAGYCQRMLRDICFPQSPWHRQNWILSLHQYQQTRWTYSWSLTWYHLHSDKDLWSLKQKVYPVRHTVTEPSRNEHAPSQPFLLGLTAGDETSVSAECAVWARLNAFGAVADKAGWKEVEQCLRTSDSAWYHTTGSTYIEM